MHPSLDSRLRRLEHPPSGQGGGDEMVSAVLRAATDEELIELERLTLAAHSSTEPNGTRVILDPDASRAAHQLISLYARIAERAFVR